MKATMTEWKLRGRAALWHVLASLLVATGAAVLVFGLWFPGDYRHMAGGVGLFALVVGVDVFMGPLLTLVAFNTGKTRRHLIADLAVIAILQLAALTYGVYTAAQARPVVLAAENGRFRVVAAQDVKADEVHRTPPGMVIGWGGPRLVGTRAPESGDEQLDSILLAVQGFDVGTRPSFWHDYALSRERVLAQSVPLTRVFAAQLGRHAELDAAVRATGLPPEALRTLPVLARQAHWYVLLDAQDAAVCGFVRVSEAD